jgi:hypothetical protein
MIVGILYRWLAVQTIVQGQCGSFFAKIIMSGSISFVHISLFHEYSVLLSSSEHICSILRIIRTRLFIIEPWGLNLIMIEQGSRYCQNNCISFMISLDSSLDLRN